MPPALALSIKIKYPDIYNRFRKIKGPVKENKKPREPRTRRRRTGRGGEEYGEIDEELGHDKPSHVMDLDMQVQAQARPHGHGQIPSVGQAKPSLDIAAEAAALPHSDIDPELNADGIPPTDDEVPTMLHGDDVDHQFDEHLARLASDGQLAEALLQLPQGAGEAEVSGSHAPAGVNNPAGGPTHGLGDIGSMDDVEENLREAVLRMARAERDDWDSLVQE